MRYGIARDTAGGPRTRSLMSDTKNIQLTEAAEQELARVLDEYREQLLDTMSQAGFIPGEDLLEVTARDVETAVRRLKFGRTRRVATRRLQAQFFVVFGAALVAAGFLYPVIEDVIKNTTQVIFIVAGVYMALIGVFFWRFLGTRYADDERETSLRARAADLDLLLDRRLEEVQRSISELRDSAPSEGHE